jgi:hypothetical protein
MGDIINFDPATDLDNTTSYLKILIFRWLVL